VILGDKHSNSLYGGAGDDALVGAAGNDYLYSGAGSYDRLFGNTGDDGLIADADAAFVEMTGGSGADVFLFAFDPVLSTGLRGEITDYDRTEGDRIAFSAAFADDLIFIGEAAFSGDGQTAFRVQSILGGAATQVQVDSDGDGATDWFFNVLQDDGLGLLGASDFYFD
jgi:Ca2+-binding RTX toxin-like protein